MRTLLATASLLILAGCAAPGPGYAGDPWARSEAMIPGFKSPYHNPWGRSALPYEQNDDAPGYGYAGKQPLFGNDGVGFAGQGSMSSCARDHLGNVFCD